MGELIVPQYENMIFQFRAFKVMIDYDLALLYEVQTKVLKQQVKRNISRFPKDFMFELTRTEMTELVTNCDRLKNLKHSSVNAMVFTEQGIAMLSSVLRSEKAILINVEIMRAFARYRGLLKEHNEMKKTISDLDNKINNIFKFLLQRIDELHEEKGKKKRIGF